MPHDHHVPPRDECVLRYMLEHRAAETPDRPFLRMHDGTDTSYAEFLNQVDGMAGALSALDVKQGDMVAVWMPMGLTGVQLWSAINWLGAVFVPINTAYKGQLLQHVLNNCAARLLLAHGDLIHHLNGLSIPALATIVSLGGTGTIEGHGREIISEPTFRDLARPSPALAQPIEPWDVQSIIYTSGTTGPSKGVISSYAHLYTMGGREGLYMFADDDRVLVCGPLFHASGMMPIYAMLARGSTAVLMPAFSTSTFWPIVRRTKVTATILLGVMAGFLAKEAPGPDDLSHTLRKVMLVPMPDDWRAFADRFGVTVFTCFNMSETAIPIVSTANPAAAGTCGRVRAGIEARIVDAHDREVPTGQSGELVLRADTPWTMNSGYFGNPDATVSAWRNGWFHTGDAFTADPDGNMFFVDRLKDSIRRRGENISSFEVESEILLHPQVRECAVIAVPSQTSEDEILAVVAAREGEAIDPAELLEFLTPRLAHFMLPRYIRVLERLPRTPTEKVEKHRLRSEGLTLDAWDREAAGIKIKRNVIV